MSFLSGPNTVLIRELQGIDRPPAVSDAIDDEFYGNALDAKWTWLDQGSATAVVSDRTLTLSITETANRIRGIYQAAPSGAWTLRAKVLRPMVNASFSHSALFVGQGAGATDDQHGVAWFNTTHFPLTWASPSSNAAAWINQAVANTMQQGYYELAWNGTNTLTPGWSNDGVAWLRWAGQVIAYTPAIVGLGFGNNTGDRSVHEFGWFRRVA